MSFTKKTWKDRQSEYPTRRKLVSTGTVDEYDVTRSEGSVSQEGDAFNAVNMNDLENRIATGFEEQKTVIDEAIGNKPTIFSGSELIEPDGMKNGDIFIIYSVEE